MFAAFLSIVVGAGALMGVLGDGLFVQHAATSASHCVTQAASGITDAFCF